MYIKKKFMYRPIAIGTLLIYSLCVILFALLGYFRAGSYASLWAGLGSGLFLIFSAALLVFKKRLGGVLTVVGSLALTLLFSIRYAITGKSVPAAFAVFSALILIFFLIQLLQDTSSQGGASPKEK